MPVLGFKINDFVYITDANFITEEIKEKINGCSVLVINALRHEKHISHFTLEEAIEIAKEVNAKQTYFIHLSHQMGLYKKIDGNLPTNCHLSYDELILEL